MKKIVSALLLVVLMMGAITGQAFAVESQVAMYPDLAFAGESVEEVGAFHLFAVPDSAKEQQVEVVPEAVSDGVVMPLEGGVTRLIPMGILVYPLVMYNGEKVYLGDDIFAFYVEPLSFQNYLRDYMTAEEQEAIKSLVTAAGFEQIGWYMRTGYSIDSYRPMRFSYYEWTGAGQSSLKGKSAQNGSNIFEVVSYFDDEISTSYKFGITGNVTYQNYVGGPTVTMPIELTVTFR